MKKIILAVDSFKGCLGSAEIEHVMKEVIREEMPERMVEMVTVADGGEGTLAAITGILSAEYRTCCAHNPCMKKIEGRYAVAPSKKMALIEMAEVSGLPLIEESERNPMLATSFGTGELICDALNHGCTEFIIGIGGSATNDAGIGMLQALGYRFYDKYGRMSGYGGQVLGQIVSWDDSHRHPLLDEAHFTVACDVANPFCGPQGAAFVFAPQKGADEAMVKSLDEGMRHLAEVIKEKMKVDVQPIPGSGAAGGMGGGLIAFLGAELVSGGELLLGLNGFNRKLQGADWVITGEGKMDRQTLMGKIPGKVMEMAVLNGVKVIGMAGKVEDEALLLQAGFDGLYAITPDEMPLSEAMQEEIARRNVRIQMKRLCHEIYK